MNNLLKDYLRFSKKETNGIVILCSAILLVFLTASLIPLFKTKKSYAKEQAEWKAQVEKYLAAVVVNEEEVYIEYFAFNPNTISEEQWIELGVPERTAKTIRNYLSKGGSFKSKEDLKKIYGFNEEQYLLLEPYINIPVSKNSKTVFSNENRQRSYSTEEKHENKSQVLTPFQFDPNVVTGQQLAQMGLSEKTIITWINFRDKGARFRSANDIKKIYGLKTEWADQLIPFVKIDNTYFTRTEDFNDFEPKRITNEPHRLIIDENVSIDVNTDQVTNWEQIDVISSELAVRIIKYKKLIGGFHRKDQVLDVYGFPAKHWETIHPHLMVNPNDITTININKASKSDLQRHPHITKMLAHWIVENRKDQAMTIQKLATSGMIDDETIEKLKPYLTE